MELTFQVPVQYCSFQHQTLLPSPVTSTTGCCFCFGSVSSFFLELVFHCSPVAYWPPTNLGSSSFTVLSFCLSYCSWSSQGKILKWFAIPFSSGPCFVRIFTSTHPSWVTLHGMAHGFIELDKAVVHVITLILLLC